MYFIINSFLFLETHESGWDEVDFDFLICGEFVRLPVFEHLKLKDINTEVTIEVEYLERFPAPEPEDSLNHDDWVSASHCFKEWYLIQLLFKMNLYVLTGIFRILTGCYDNSIHLWKIDGTHKKTIPGHCGPVKAVKWIEVSEESAGFVRFVIKYESHYLELLT